VNFLICELINIPKYQLRYNTHKAMHKQAPKCIVMIKRKFKQWWSTISPISTKRTTTWRWISRSWFATGKNNIYINHI